MTEYQENRLIGQLRDEIADAIQERDAEKAQLIEEARAQRDELLAALEEAQAAAMRITFEGLLIHEAVASVLKQRICEVIGICNAAIRKAMGAHHG